MRLPMVIAAGAFILFMSASDALPQGFSRSITSGYRISPNITYVKSGDWEGKLDIYSRINAGPEPTLIYIHGGAMPAGTKDTSLFALLPYLESGWNVINLEPRYAGVSLAPATLENCWCAMRWIIKNAAMYGFDATKLVISGSSSGGWFAVATAMTPHFDGWDHACPGKEEPKIAAVVNWYGNWDLANILQGPNKKRTLPAGFRVFRIRWKLQK